MIYEGRVVDIKCAAAPNIEGQCILQMMRCPANPNLECCFIAVEDVDQL